jgi:hypothetical protein
MIAAPVCMDVITKIDSVVPHVIMITTAKKMQSVEDKHALTPQNTAKKESHVQMTMTAGRANVNLHLGGI